MFQRTGWYKKSILYAVYLVYVAHGYQKVFKQVSEIKAYNLAKIWTPSQK